MREDGRVACPLHYRGGIRSRRMESGPRPIFSPWKDCRGRSAGTSSPPSWPSTSPRRSSWSAARRGGDARPGPLAADRPALFRQGFLPGSSRHGGEGGGALVLLLFPGFGQLAGTFAGRGRPQEAGDDRRVGQRRRPRLQQPDHGHPVQRGGDVGPAEHDAAGPRRAGQHHPGLLHRHLADPQPPRLRQAPATGHGALQHRRPRPRTSPGSPASPPAITGSPWPRT